MAPRINSRTSGHRYVVKIDPKHADSSASIESLKQELRELAKWNGYELEFVQRRGNIEIYSRQINT